MKRILSVVLAPVLFGACSTGNIGPTGDEQRGATSESRHQLVVRSCFEQVLASIDPVTGTLVDGGAIDPAQLIHEVEACIFAHGVDAGLPSLDASVPGSVDASVPVVDAGVSSLDASVPTADAGRGHSCDGGHHHNPFPWDDGGGFPPFPWDDDGGFPPFPSADDDAGFSPPFPLLDAGFPTGLGDACSASCDCPHGLQCFNPLQETCPSVYARCLP